MKVIYLIAAFVIVTTGLHAQRQVIPATASVDNIEKSNMGHPSSAADDSLFNHVRILPNLAMGRVTLIVDDANTNVIQQGECVIYNSAGTPVAKNPFTTGANQIYVTTLPAGMYFIKLIQKNGEQTTRKFVVMR